MSNLPDRTRRMTADEMMVARDLATSRHWFFPDWMLCARWAPGFSDHGQAECRVQNDNDREHYTFHKSVPHLGDPLSRIGVLVVARKAWKDETMVPVWHADGWRVAHHPDIEAPGLQWDEGQPSEIDALCLALERAP